MRRALTCALPWLALLVASCRKPGPAVSTSPAAGASASVGAAEPPSLQLASDVAVPGLRVQSGSLARHGSLWGYSDLAIDLSKARLEVVSSKRGAPLNQLLPVGAVAIVNGGYFEADFRPSAWLKSQGSELSPKADASKGGVFALGATSIYLGPMSGLTFEPELAVQSFPLIVEPFGKPGIQRDDGRRAARTVVCLVDGALHFVVIAAPRGDGPTLYESVALLREPAPRGFGCQSALNLDGGPSSGVWFSARVASKQRLPVAPVAYGIAILPR